jgi:hypothetical protein
MWQDNPAILLVPVLTGVLQLIFSKMMAPEKPVQAKQDDFNRKRNKRNSFLFRNNRFKN